MVSSASACNFRLPILELGQATRTTPTLSLLVNPSELLRKRVCLHRSNFNGFCVFGHETDGSGWFFKAFW